MSQKPFPVFQDLSPRSAKQLVVNCRRAVDHRCMTCTGLPLVGAALPVVLVHLLAVCSATWGVAQFVLEKALAAGLRPIVVLNKVREEHSLPEHSINIMMNQVNNHAVSHGRILG